MTETIDTAQPEALRLADELDEEAGRITQYTNRPGDLLRELAATELRRLHSALAAAEARNATLTDDAARLDWLEQGGCGSMRLHGALGKYSSFIAWGYPLAFKTIRAAIDAARAAASISTKGDANG